MTGTTCSSTHCRKSLQCYNLWRTFILEEQEQVQLQVTLLGQGVGLGLVQVTLLAWP